MKVINKRQATLITAAIIVLAVAVCGTLAYVIAGTSSVENTFTPSHVACAVLENGSNTEHTSDVVSGVAQKTNVMIKNTGNTEAYIRVAVVVTWKSADGRVWAQQPTDNDYTLEPNTNDWVKGSDGYYYHKAPVAAGDTTKAIIKSAALKEGITPPVGSDGTKYYLDIEIVASAIQSTPVSVVMDEWKVTVSNGSISGN